MSSPDRSPQNPEDPRSPLQHEPTVVEPSTKGHFDPQAWTVVAPSTPAASAVPSQGSQSKTSAPGALDDAVGQILGAYEIQGTVARGGQGVVYRARHKELGTSVALKLLLAHQDARSVQQFRQEAQVLARLRHPNLIVVTDLGTMVGVPFLAMDYIQGSDLKKIVNTRGVLGFETARNLLAPIARTLQYCHDRGLVHRDVKPQNILIEEQTGRPILIDFGLLKRAEQFEKEYGEITTPMAAPIEMGGTPSFMAPEQTGAPGFGPTGPHSDVYGLGSTLYFLLTGKAPFVGAKTIQTLNMVVKDPPVDPRKHRPDIPDDLAELCLWAMAKQAEDRPASAEAFAQALKPEPAPEGDASFYVQRGTGRRDKGDLAGALSALARAAELVAQGDPLEKEIEAVRQSVEAQLARPAGAGPAAKIAAAIVFLILAGALAFALLRGPASTIDVNDKTPPEVELDPVTEWDGGPLAVSCTVKDKQPKIVHWVLVIDGKEDKTVFDAAVGPTGRVDARFDPASISSQISTLSVIATAEDMNGNKTKAVTTVHLKKQPLRITIESPTEKLVTNEKAVSIRAIVSAGRLRDAEVVLRAGDSERVRLPLRVTGDLATLAALPLPDGDGTCSVEVHCTDVLGNASKKDVTVIVDRTPPRISVLAPPGEPTVREAEIKVRAKITDASEPSVLLVGRPLQAEGGGEYGGMLRLPRDGRIEGRLVARDAAGNESEVTVVANRDSTAPKLVSVERTPAESEVSAEKLSVVVVTDEPCEAWIAGVKAAPDAERRNHAADVPLALGKNVLQVVVTDTLGNTETIAPKELVVERVLPAVLRAAWWPVTPAQKAHAVEKQVVVAFENDIGMRFALVPPGSFTMGSPASEPGRDTDEYAHEVILTKAFYMGATEVTNAQFRKFRPKHSSGKMGKAGAELSLDADDQPAVNVTHAEAKEFCAWLDTQLGVEGVHRLPTEAEWEYACRAGTTGPSFWKGGPDTAGPFLNGAGGETAKVDGIVPSEPFPNDDSWPVSAPVGAPRQANPFGLFDMLGNAAEWVADFEGPYPSGTVTDPTGPASGKFQLIRGGSFADGPVRCRPAYRQRLSDGRDSAVGFRIVAVRPVERR